MEAAILWRQATVMRKLEEAFAVQNHCVKFTRTRDGNGALCLQFSVRVCPILYCSLRFVNDNVVSFVMVIGRLIRRRRLQLRIRTLPVGTRSR